LPGEKEWNDLYDKAGNSKRLKSKQWDGTDDYGFGALPGGSRAEGGSFSGSGSQGYWWSSSATGDLAYAVGMRSGNDGRSRDDHPKAAGFSIRCVKG
jgi:uncharacterized protein (TIGR02145 family)